MFKMRLEIPDVISERSYKEYEIDKGELLLLHSDHSQFKDSEGNFRRFNFGTFEEVVKKGTETVNLSGINYNITDRTNKRDLLVIAGPIVLEKGMIYGLPSYTPCNTPNLIAENYAGFRIRPSLELVIGQESIVGFLNGLNGFEPHAEWINKLNKPYVKN